MPFLPDPEYTTDGDNETLQTLCFRLPFVPRKTFVPNILNVKLLVHFLVYSPNFTKNKLLAINL